MLFILLLSRAFSIEHFSVKINGFNARIIHIFCLDESKIALSRILQAFDIRLPSEYKLEVIQRVTLQPKGDLPCTMTFK